MQIKNHLTNADETRLGQLEARYWNYKRGHGPQLSEAEESERLELIHKANGVSVPDKKKDIKSDIDFIRGREIAQKYSL